MPYPLAMLLLVERVEMEQTVFLLNLLLLSKHVMNAVKNPTYILHLS